MPFGSRIVRRYVAISAALALRVNSSVANENAHCGEPGQPWVSVAFESGTWNESFEAVVIQDLKAGLASRGIAACAEGRGPETPPVAAIVIGSGNQESVKLTVEIRDALTEKRVSRDVDLTNMPADGRALAIAVAADELVWASWAEIAYKSTYRRSAAPPEVVTAVERAIQPPPSPKKARPRATRMRLGAQLAADHFGAGLTLLGADALAVAPFTPKFRLKIAAGAREGLVVRAQDGRVRSIATNLTVESSLLVLRGANAELSWTLGSRLAWVSLYGEASPGVLGTRMNGIAVFARTGPGVGLRVGGSLWVELNGSLGVPLRAVQASDTGRIITGASGLEQSTALSLQGEL